MVSPERNLTADYQLRGWHAGRWITIQAVTYTSSGSNTDYLIVKSANSGIKFRFVGNFTGDSFNSKAPKAISKSFVID